MRVLTLCSLSLVPIVALAARAATPRERGVRFEETHLIIELNDTAGDVGVQVFLDGEPWKQLCVFDPDGVKLLDIRDRGSFGLQGLTELFFESSEPPLADLTLEEFEQRFPEGEYAFEGLTLEGDEIEGTAVFTHTIPGAPLILTPAEGSVQDRNHTVVAWRAVPDPRHGRIDAYQVIVTQLLDVFPTRTFSVHVPAAVNSVTVPAEFLLPRASYEFEVLAIEAGGNQTISSSTFRTR
jgi:hypothetical protein